MLYSPFVVQSGVPQGSVLGPLLFNIFINDLCDVINHSKCLLFADNFKIYRAITSSNDCFRLQSDIDYVHKRRSTNFMKPNFRKIKDRLFYQEDERSELYVQTRKFLYTANRLY
jgi:hypothetical protein